MNRPASFPPPPAITPPAQREGKILFLAPDPLAQREVHGFAAGSTRLWLGLAVGCLILAGILAIVLVLARVPGLSHWIPDPLFAKRCLVVHVNLSLVFWLLAFLGAMSQLLIPRDAGSRAFGAFWLFAAGAGAILTLGAAAVSGAKPVLSNYVPAIDHPLFLTGLLVFALGVGGAGLAALTSPQLGRSLLPRPAAITLKTALVAFLLSLCAFYASAWTTPRGLPAESYYELLFWGGGHMLQSVHVLGMIAAWYILTQAATGKNPVSPWMATLIAGTMLLPLIPAPLLALAGTDSATYHGGFTRIMRWGIFPAATLALLACLRTLATHRGWLRHPKQRVLATGLLVSVALTLTGFVLGAFIRGPNTVVPAHYHAAVGGVTAAYMTLAYWLASKAGLASAPEGLRRWQIRQPLIYGVGQGVFALGFAWAGIHGAARKTYGAEQHLRTFGEQFGMAVMGIGGLLAVAGGLLFLIIMVTVFQRSRSALFHVPQRRSP